MTVEYHLTALSFILFEGNYFGQRKIAWNGVFAVYLESRPWGSALSPVNTCPAYVRQCCFIQVFVKYCKFRQHDNYKNRAYCHVCVAW